MNQNSSIIAQNDNLVSRIVKLRDPFCMLRLKGCTGHTIDPAHCFGRKNMATRWNLECVYGACRSCHSFADTHPELKRVYFIKIMGEEKYDKMLKLSNTNAKFLPMELKCMAKILKIALNQYAK